jgi:hypothetical protein
MLKRLLVPTCLALQLAGCDYAEQVPSEDLHVSAVLSEATYKPERSGYEFGYDFWDDKWGLRWVNHPAEYKVVFTSKVGNFSFGTKDMYETYKGFLGKELDLVYCEIYRVTYETQPEKGGDKKERDRVFLYNQFIKAQLK